MFELASMNELGQKTVISTAGCSYAVWTQGTGHPVVLLHGWPVTSLHWRKVVPFLVAEKYKTICIDLRALGESEAKDGNFEKEVLGREILQVVQKIIGEGRKFSIVGHDWGGSVAIALAKIASHVTCIAVEEEIPPGVTATILEPGASRYPNWHGGLHRQKPLAEKLISGQQQTYFEFFIQLRRDPKSLSDEDRNAFLNAYSEPSRLPLFLEYYRVHQEDSLFFRSIFEKKLATPVLALGGKFGMGLAVSKALDHLFIASRHYIFEKSGHYPAQEEPEKYAEKLISFLSEFSDS